MAFHGETKCYFVDMCDVWYVLIDKALHDMRLAWLWEKGGVFGMT